MIVIHSVLEIKKGLARVPIFGLQIYYSVLAFKVFCPKIALQLTLSVKYNVDNMFLFFDIINFLKIYSNKFKGLCICICGFSTSRGVHRVLNSEISIIPANKNRIKNDSSQLKNIKKPLLIQFH